MFIKLAISLSWSRTRTSSIFLAILLFFAIFLFFFCYFIPLLEIFFCIFKILYNNFCNSFAISLPSFPIYFAIYFTIFAIFAIFYIFTVLYNFFGKPFPETMAALTLGSTWHSDSYISGKKIAIKWIFLAYFLLEWWTTDFS